MASETRYAGTGANDSSAGTVAWSNTGNITSSNDSYASAALSMSENTQYLKATNFGFNISGTINGIVVEWERDCDMGDVVDVASRIIKGGTIGGTDKSSATNWPTSDGYETYGNSTELWGLSWTSSDINASNFGAAIRGSNGGGMEETAKIDTCRITVYYSGSYSETGSGAAFGTGSATIAVTYATTASGAALAAGHGAMVFDDKGSGAVLCAGEAVPYVFIPVGGAAFGAGSGTAAFIYNLSPSGAALAAGSAGPNQIFNPSPSGAALAAGSATVTDGIVGTGAALVSGSASPTFTYNQSGSGAALAAGEIRIQAHWQANPSLTIEITTVSSSLVTDFTSAAFTITTTAVINTISVQNLRGSGAALAAGSATINTSEIEPASGAALAAGSAAPSLAHTAAASGAALASGSAGPTQRFNPGPTGAALAAGSATATSIYGSTVAGAVRATGAAAVGVQTITTADFTIAHNLAVSPVMWLRTKPAQTIQTTAAIETVMNQVERGSGAAKVSGTAPYSTNETEPTSGGALAAGSVIKTDGYFVRGSGAALAGGAAAVSTSEPEQASGAVLVSGSAGPTQNFNPGPTGAALAAGSAAVVVQYAANASGAVKPGGSAPNTENMLATADFTITLAATAKPYQHLMEGIYQYLNDNLRITI